MASILNDPRLARFFAERFETPLFPSVTVAALSSDLTCSMDKDTAFAMGGKMNEVAQEVAFIHWLERVYQGPPAASGTTNLTFLPLCLYANATTKQERAAHNSTGQDASPSTTVVTTTFIGSWHRLGSIPLTKAVSRVLLQADSHECFYPAPHPMLYPPTGSTLRRCRALIVDKTYAGSTQDVVVPYTALDFHRLTTDALNTSSADPRPTLLFGCARHKFYGPFGGLRKRIFDVLSKLKLAPLVDVGAHRTPEACRAGFYRSKYCLVLPGDTASTASSTRAMLAGCVPVFVVDDWRDLPFAPLLNYSAFSLRLHERDVTCAGCALRLVERLNASRHGSAAYPQLAAGTAAAADFFDYAHAEGPRSPYGAALASIVLDIASAHVPAGRAFRELESGTLRT